MRYFLLVAFWIVFTTVLRGQQTYSLSGVVTDSTSGETLIGASVYIPEKPGTGTYTDMDGGFSFRLPPGKYHVVIGYYSYKTDTLSVNLQKDTKVSVPLPVQAKQMEEIVLKGPAITKNVGSAELGKLEVNVEQAKKLPVLLGEVDLMKTIQLLPGIQTAGEGNSGFYVRGGGPDQNLVLLDNATIYNTGHLFGFFSVFNSSAISGVTLYKGNMPAYYGGRLASVVDFTVREGDYKKYKVDGGVGIIASRVTVQGPIAKDKASFMISGRRTYLDILSKPLVHRNGTKGIPYYFYDLNGKFAWKVTKRDKLTLSAYNGRDNVKLTIFDGRFKMHTYWGNNTATLRWDHVYSEKLIQNTSLIFNQFEFYSSAGFDKFNTSVSSGIRDYTFRLDYDYTPNIRHHITYGAIYTRHKFTPRRTTANADTVNFNTTSVDDYKYADDIAVYLADDFDLSDKIRINVGLRYNAFLQVGPYDYITQNANGYIDTAYYHRGQLVKAWGGLEPRIGIRYLLNKNASIKTAFNVNNQYINMVNITNTSMPFDIWLPSSIRIKPQRGWQYSLGYFRNLKDNNYELSTEVYYKEMYNQLAYSQYYVPSVSGEIEEELVRGKGWSYGVELFIKKKYGKLQGWIGYTLSRTLRRFPQINNDRVFPARYDRRHNLNVVATLELNERWVLGGTFVFATGQAITLPSHYYFIGGVVYYQYGDRNSSRMQPYNRLDLSITYKNKTEKRFKSSFTFAIYNVYNRKNPYIYFMNPSGNPATGNFSIQAEKLYLFPILPSLTWNFSF